ncbi:MAG: sulfate/thiosulfate transport system permease protein [Candidatus Binatota bacterium]|nr:sulfate/thiosulfate transport system permease protein [Candidatus Binatota bacterium]
MRPRRTRRVLPGFGPTMGFTLLYAALVVLIPLSATAVKTAELDGGAFWKTVTSPRVLASYRLSFGAAFGAAAASAVAGLLVAWVLVRYRFPGRRLLDSLVDLPFALPTAVAGIALTSLYAPSGWIGRLLEPLGVKVAYTPLGVFVAMTFVALPFAIRTVEPVLEDLDVAVEEAAASLGAGRWQIFRRVLFPALLPAVVTGFALAFARAVGEYGSIVFISGNMPMRTEIAPLLIVTKLEQFDYAGANAIALVTLIASFTCLLLVNLLEGWASRRGAGTRGVAA